MHAESARRFLQFVVLPALVTFLSTSHARALIKGLPTKTFQIEGGSVVVQAGATQNTEIQPGPFGNLRYPIRYLVNVENRTATALSIEVEFHFPDKKKPGSSGSSEVPAGKGASYWWNRFGLIADEKIAIRIALKSKQADGSVLAHPPIETYLLFEGKEKDVFLKAFDRSLSGRVVHVPFISGLRDVDPPPDGQDAPGTEVAGAAGFTPVPGSAADSVLQQDISRMVRTLEAAERKDCDTIAIQRAEPIPPDEAIGDSRLSEKAAKKQRKLREKGVIGAERWFVTSCGVESVYEIVVLPSPQGGTDFSTRKISSTPVPAAHPATAEPTSGPPPSRPRRMILAATDRVRAAPRFSAG